MSIRITELDAITSLQSGDYIAVDNESTGTHKFKALDISANVAGNIANTYSSSASYAIGQYCLYDNNLYKCTTTISTPEAWNSSHWIQVTVGEGLYEKVDKVSGKGLSTNDFTNEYKQKLGGIEAGAEVNVQADWTENDSSKDDYIKNKPGNATTSASGFMSASDKQKLDNIEAGAEVNVQPNWAEDDSSKDDYIKNKPTIDTALSTSSDNAVRNSAITAGINQVQGNLDTEITNRQNAVSGEQLARENADSALDGRLDTVEETLPNKANINGSYEEMTVGSAEQLISTESIEDTEPYTFRASGGGMDIGDRETDKLVGGTVAWNQLMEYVDRGAYGTLTTVMTSNGEYVVNGTTSSAVSGSFGNVLVVNHVYLFDSGTTNTNIVLTNSDTWTTDSGAYIKKIVGTGKKAGFYFKAGTYSNDKFTPQYFDLTQMFGSTIADALCAMEQAEAGTGVAWFKRYFPNPYYAYDAGSLQSVNVASHDMTGFNQWDEEWELGYFDLTTGEPVTHSSISRSKNFIPVLADTDYYYKSNGANHTILFYDGNKGYIGKLEYGGTSQTFTTPTNARYMKFAFVGTTYNNDICINRVWTGNRNGEYEPYELHSYAYDESVELRGIPSLVDGELVYDGDTYEADGTVSRKYGYVDLGTLTWQYDTSGQYPVFWASLSQMKLQGANIVCPKYPALSEAWTNYIANNHDKTIASPTTSTSSYVMVQDSAYSTAASFKTAMNGVYLVYELDAPTSEQATGFTNPQVVDAFGTEEYVDAGVKNETRDVSIPVGHETQYMANLRNKLQHLPNLAKEDGDYFVNQTGTQMKLKKVEGYYEDLVSGTADNLTTKIRTNDQTPYLFRTAGGSVDIGDREYINGITGGTVAWNQLIRLPSNPYTSDGVTASFDNETGKISLSGTTTGSYCGIFSPYFAVEGHKYLRVTQVLTNPNNVDFAVRAFNIGWGLVMNVCSANETRSTNVGISGFTVGTDMSGITLYTNIFDLTQMFGSTIADYIYSLEQATAGAGVAFFKSLFPKPYYAYNAGELMSVSGLVSHDMVGFNAWDEEWQRGYFSITDGRFVADDGRVCSKNFIQVVPNAGYYINSSNQTIWVLEYDADKNYYGIYKMGRDNVITFSDKCRYIQFYTLQGYGTAYKNDICINISWDGSEDGNYEPYQKWSYPLDSDLELRGIPKLDASNNLYYDGDVYEADGTVIRKWAEIDLGSLEWQKSSSGNKFYATVSPAYPMVNDLVMLCARYAFDGVGSSGDGYYGDDKTIRYYYATALACEIYIHDEAYSDAIAFKTAMDGVKLVYPLATPTTETADPYTDPQIVNDFGTEEFVIDDTIDVPIPVGHNTDYPINLKSKLEMAPDSPDGDGDYIVRQTNGTNEYVPLIIEDQLPAVPSTDGTYTLTVTIASGEATYSWT